MDGMLDLARMAATMAVLVPACVSDLRTREVPDGYWTVLGSFGILCMFLSALLGGMRPEHLMMAAGSALLFVCVMFEVERNRAAALSVYGSAAVLLLVPVLTSAGDPVVRTYASVPLMSAVYVIMFRAGLIKGGADAKCLIAMTVVFPSHPEVGTFPMSSPPAVPFSLAVLLHAALLCLAVPLYCLLRNAAAGDRMRAVGYRMGIRQAMSSHVWPLERAEDGTAVYTGKAQDPLVLEDLEGTGAERVWVTPMIPFVVPLTAAAAFVSLAGDAVLAFILLC